MRLWEAYNLHIAWLMERADPAAVAEPRARHNLDVVAMQGVDRAEPATLDYVMRDYVAHLKHHLRQVFGEE